MSVSILYIMSVVITALLGFSFDDAEQSAPPVVKQPLTISSVEHSPKPFPAGGNGKLTLKVSLHEGYFVYQKKLSVEVTEPSATKIANIEGRPVVEFTDPVDGEIKKGISGDAEVSALFEIPESTPAGATSLKLKISYLACTKKFCLLPKTIEHATTIQVIDPDQPRLVAASAPAVDSKKTSELENWFARGTFFAFAFVFLGGVLTSFTPCVFPMLPVTLAVLGASGRNKSRLSRLALSLSYVFGIALTYALFGVVAASTGALFGSIMQNPLVVGSICLVFVGMALAMFGVWEFQVPSFVRQSVGGQKTSGGFFGAFATGAIAGIVASPCVGPVLFAILAYVAQTQNIALGFALLFVFALGLGQIFIVIGMFSELLEKLPRAGTWMNFVNFLFGCSMLGASVYFAQFILPADWNWVTLGFAAILVTSIYGVFQWNGESPAQRLVKGLGIAAFGLGLLSIGFGVVQIVAPRPTAVTPVAQQQTGKINWQPYSTTVLESASKNAQFVIIDFYADWCVACVEFEKFTFTDPRVAEKMNQMVLVKVDATEMTEENEKVLAEFGVLGLPTLIFIGRDGKVIDELTTTGFENADKFLKRLEKLEGLSSSASL